MFRRGDKVTINGEVFSVWEDSNGHKVTVIANTPDKDLKVFPEFQATLHTVVSDEAYDWLMAELAKPVTVSPKNAAFAARPSVFV